VLGECRSPFEASNKIKDRQTMCKLNVMLRFVEKGRLLSTVGRPFLIIEYLVD